MVGREGQGCYSCAATLIGGPCLPGLTALPAGVTGTSLTVDQHLEWFGTVRGRAGILATPRVLLYATGGLAYGSFKTTGAFAGVTPAGIAVGSVASTSDTRLGWTVGAGIEGKITNNWSAKLEYLYMDFDSFRAGSFTLLPGSAIGGNVELALQGSRPACRHQLHLRRSGRREVLIEQSSQSLTIKPRHRRGFFVWSSHDRRARRVAPANCNPTPESGLRLSDNRCNMAPK